LLCDRAMLSKVVRAARPLGRVQRVRMMSALPEKIVADLEYAKSLTTATKEIYSEADLEKDIAAKTVDISRLQEACSFYSPAIMKLLSKSVQEMTAPMPEVKTIDWAAWKEKLEGDSVVDEIKAIVEDPSAETKFAAMMEEAKAADMAEFTADMATLHEVADKEAKADAAELLQCIADLEIMQKQVDQIDSQTIAEILEMEPELRKEIEAELDSHNWAP